MIYVQMSGRCGNQLFRYAFAKKLESVYKEKTYYNYYDINRLNFEDSSFYDNLSEFCIEYEKIDVPHIIYKLGSFKQIVCYTIYRLIDKLTLSKMQKAKKFSIQNNMQKVMNKFGIYNLIQGSAPIGISKEKNKFILGNYENKQYFEEFREKLRCEIVPRNISEKCQEFVKVIQQEESVCITIRRGDFLNTNLARSRNICTEKYFQQAIEKMKQLRPECTFFVFSDEIDWVKKNYNFGENVYYESGNDTIAEKLYMMSSCKNFIISNSTFSWWAQYLAKNENKIVVSPDHWFNYKEFEHPLIDNSWILIEC